MRFFPLLTAGWLAGLALAPNATAQAACGDSALARADTTAAIADCEALAIGPPENPEARFRAGRLLLTRYYAGARTGADRDRAERHFQSASVLTPDSARYVMGLAEIARTRTLVFTRSQADNLMDRADELARTHGSGDQAEIEYRAAVMDWERYEQLAHRYQFFGDAQTVDPYVMLNEWKDVQNFFENRVRPEDGDVGGDNRRAAEAHLRAALAADPRHPGAAGLLAVLLLEEGRDSLMRGSPRVMGSVLGAMPEHWGGMKRRGGPWAYTSIDGVCSLGRRWKPRCCRASEGKEPPCNVP